MEKLIKDEIMNAAGAAVAAGDLPACELLPFNVDINLDTSSALEQGRGDFSCNVALVNAKALKMPPRRIAEILVSHIYADAFGKVGIAGAGFINFTVKAEWYGGVVTGVNGGEVGVVAGSRPGAASAGRVLVEFVSANPTGPMHIGNARGGALGDTIAELLTFAGYEVEREFYVNDGGNQVKKLGLSLDYRYRQVCGGEPLRLIADTAESEYCVTGTDAPFTDDGLPEDSYHGEDIAVHAVNFHRIHGDKYLSETEEVRRNALVEYALPLNLAKIETDLAKYRVHYDNWFRESSLTERIPNILSKLDSAGATYIKDGALWFRGVEFGGKYGVQEDFVLVRENGVPTYITPDIAYHYNKLCERKYDLAVDILGADHHGYSGRMYACMDALGAPVSCLKILLMQMVMLTRDGKAVKLSKRSGRAITLATLLDEVPVDAARFFFTLKDADTQLNFDLDLAVEESNKNPVYYAQYAHARICSLLNKVNAGDGAEVVNSGYVYAEPAEQALIKTLYIFPKVISEAAAALNPAKITRCALDLAAAFHKFYDVCRVSGEGVTLEIQRGRVALIKAVKTSLTSALGILKVNAPERM